MWIKLELVLAEFGLKVPLALRFGVMYWLVFGFGQGERGGRVGVWSGVMSFKSPVKMGTSAIGEKQRERDVYCDTFTYLMLNLLKIM